MSDWERRLKESNAGLEKLAVTLRQAGMEEWFRTEVLGQVVRAGRGMYTEPEPAPAVSEDELARMPVTGTTH